MTISITYQNFHHKKYCYILKKDLTISLKYIPTSIVNNSIIKTDSVRDANDNTAFDYAHWGIFEGICLTTNTKTTECVELNDSINIYHTDYLKLEGNTLTIFSGYAWDGASKVLFQTNNLACPSLIHDALYQLLREKVIEQKYRKKIDKTFYKHCRGEGVNIFRARIMYRLVRIFGGFFSK